MKHNSINTDDYLALPAKPTIENRASRYLNNIKVFWLTFAQDRAAAVALVFIAIVVLLALLAPYISPYDPNEAVSYRNLGMGEEGLFLGSDSDGRDILSRLIWGARVSLLMGVVPTFMAMVFGLLLGLVAAYLKGITDNVIMRVLDVFFAFPVVLLAIVVAGFMKPGLMTIMISIFVALIPYVARLARTNAISVTQQPYVEAARASGATHLTIVLRYILPNTVSPVLIYCTTLIGMMMVLGSSLSYLGLGVQPPTADWGTMVSEGRATLYKAPHISTIPGVAIVLVALAFSFIGDGLRDALDPKSRIR